MAMTSAPAAMSSRLFGRSPPSSGRPSTAASGTAMLSAIAVESDTASCSRPAPARSADTPASSTAPGVNGEPPTTSTVPRDFLSPCGFGSGQSRNRCGVMIVGSGAFGTDVLLDGRRRLFVVQVTHVVEQLGPYQAVRPAPAADRAVGDAYVVGDGHQLLLVQPLG